MGLFSFLDGLFSYLSIYLFSMYLFLSNHGELKMELLIMNTLLMSLTFINFGSVIWLDETCLSHALINKQFYLYKKRISMLVRDRPNPSCPITAQSEQNPRTGQTITRHSATRLSLVETVCIFEK
jgi:hypothetical protein